MSQVVTTYFLFPPVISSKRHEMRSTSKERGTMEMHSTPQPSDRERGILRNGMDVAILENYSLIPAANSMKDGHPLQRIETLHWHTLHLKSGSVFVNPQTQSPHTKLSKYF